MDFAASATELLTGVVKRVWVLLPALLLDPFDIANRVFDVNYQPPHWIIWTVFALGIAVAAMLTYHDARRRQDWRIGMKTAIYEVVEAKPELGIVDVARELDLHVGDTMPRAVIELVRELINEGKLTNTSRGLRVR